MASPRVFTIPASVPFVPALIRALTEDKFGIGFPTGRDPLALADATLYLPTRRACRLARDHFLEVTGGSAAILPRIVPIGDVDEDEIVFAQAAAGATAADALALPPELGGLERRMLLTRLVLQWASSAEVRTAEGAPLVANNPASALALADELARLMDDMTTRQSALGQARRTGARQSRPVLAVHAALPQDRPRDLARDPRGARRDRAGGAARPADRRRGETARPKSATAR